MGPMKLGVPMIAFASSIVVALSIFDIRLLLQMRLNDCLLHIYPYGQIQIPAIQIVYPNLFQ